MKGNLPSQPLAWAGESEYPTIADTVCSNRLLWRRRTPRLWLRRLRSAAEFSPLVFLAYLN
jgi:hypothetical protein